MSASYSDYVDYYRRGPYAPYIKEHRLAGSAPVRLLTVAQPAGSYPDPPLPEVTVLAVTRGTFNGHMDVGAGRWRGRWNVDSVTLAPPNVATDYVLDAPFELLLLAVPIAALCPLLQEVCPESIDFGRLHAAPFRDTFVKQLCQRMWNEAADQNPLGSMFVDAAVIALGAALLRLAKQAPTLECKGGLAPVALRRTTDYMEAHLAQHPRLEEIAELVGLSPYHFSRAFRQSTGMPPYRWLLTRRLERAKELLMTTRFSIAQIAAIVGYEDPNQLARVFRKEIGMSPSGYRGQRS